MKNLILILGLMITLVPASGSAGLLDKFETSVTGEKYEKETHGTPHRGKKNQGKKDRGRKDNRSKDRGKHRGREQSRSARDHSRSAENRRRNRHRHSDNRCSGFFRCFFDVFMQARSTTHTNNEPVKPDNPRNSLMTLDTAFQSIQPGIFGLDTTFQIRMKRVNIEGRLTRYIESSPLTVLDVNHWKVVFPARPNDSVTVGLGLGIYNLSGNSSSTGGSLSFPVVYQKPGSYWELGMTPTWAKVNGRTISDLDFRASYRTSRVNFFAGHRAIDTGSQILKGPYFGIGLNI